jgi:Fic family protein
VQPSDFERPQLSHLSRNPNGCWSFVPPPLPLDMPLSAGLIASLPAADRAIGELAGVGAWHPNPRILVDPFLRREAVHSSRIEGTVATVTDLVLYEAEATGSRGDVPEVHNYVRALGRVTDPRRRSPLDLWLIRDMHRTLTSGVPRANTVPGEFRNSQNWIGRPGCLLDDAVYVPPPVAEMRQALQSLETYLRSPSPLPPLVRIALVHYQFEAIHPFLDGNGRVGRLLVSLLLQEWGLLPQPLLYLSAYFERERDGYYDSLASVSLAGGWERWVRFFLRGVEVESRDVVDRALRLADLRAAHHERVRGAQGEMQPASLVDHLFERPALDIAGAKERLGVTFGAAAHHVQRLIDVGILQEVTRRDRNRVFVAWEILDLL